MASFADLQQNTLKFVNKLMDYSGLDRKLVENVFSYARCLPKTHSTEIDENIFTAQMLQHFGLTSKFMISLMYRGMKEERSNGISMETYCKCICTFLKNDLEKLIDFVFKVYDINMDGAISYMEMYTFLKPCVLMTSDSEDVDSEEHVRDLIEIVIGVSDMDRNREINMAEFRRLVKSNISYLQMLGPCLPSIHHIEKFKARLSDKTHFDIRKEFQFERYKCLHDIPPSRKEQLYPMVLDMP